MHNYSQGSFPLSSFPRRRESSQGNCTDTDFFITITDLAYCLDSRMRGNDGV